MADRSSSSSRRRRLLARMGTGLVHLFGRGVTRGYTSAKAANTWLTGPHKDVEHLYTRRALIGAALVGSAAVLGHQISRIGPKRRARQVRELERPPYQVKEGLMDFHSTEADCAKYIRTVDEVYGIKYQQADAWHFANVNVRIWDRKSPNEPFPQDKLRPGMVVGLFHPDSSYLHKLEEPGANPYTHLAMVMGFGERTNGRVEPIITHFFGGKVRVDWLYDFVAADEGEIRAIIGPAWGMSKFK